MLTILNKQDQFQILRNVRIGENVQLWNFINLYDCEIGNDCMIGTFVEIQKNVKIGNGCRIQSHTFICEGVTLEDGVFVGHNVTFINDNHPSAEPLHAKCWQLRPILVNKGASIGSGAIIRGGVTIGTNATVAAGAMVTKNVVDGDTVMGVPAKSVIAQSDTD